MTSHSIDWKRRADAAFAPLRSIDRSWLPESLRQHPQLLEVAALCVTTRRLLYNCLPKASTSTAVDIVEPDWARGGHKKQQRIVIRLGALACATPLRRTIEQSELAMLYRVIDDETYRDAMTQAAVLIRNNIDNDYRQAMRSGEIAFFIVAMGISVLESVAPQDAPFIHRNIRWQFARKAWAMRRADLICDRDCVIEILDQGGDV